MKYRVKNLNTLAFLIAVFGACQVESPQAPEMVDNYITFDVKAHFPVTRTEIADDGVRSSFNFVLGDAIGFFAGNSITNCRLEYIDAETGSFWGKVRLDDISQDYRPSVQYCAYYPFSSVAGDDASALSGHLLDIQSAPYDERADYLVATPVVDEYCIQRMPQLDFFFSKHLFSLVKLVITNTSGDLADERIQNIGLKSSGAPLAGDFTFNASDIFAEAVLSTDPDAVSDLVTVVYQEAEQPLLGEGINHTVYAVVNAGVYEAGDLQLLVETSKYSFSLPTRSKATLKNNQVTVLPVVDLADGEKVTKSSNRIKTFSITAGGIEYSSFKITDSSILIHVPNATDLSSVVVNFSPYEGVSSVMLDGIVQTSGSGSHDFSDFTTPPVYTVTGNDGISRDYSIVLFNLPVVNITTPSPIVSKDEWTKKCSVTIIADDGTETDYGEKVQVKGRGNTTWRNGEKKPYTIKLNKAQKVLGMPAEKRWNFLANYFDRSDIKNDISLKLAQESEGLDWTPRGRFVELILNGIHLGNYYLCEHIKVAENRVNIWNQDEDDNTTWDETGGYLLEFDTYYDEKLKFRPTISNLPVNLKNPDWNGYDITYIQNWINNLEAILSGENLCYEDYKDLLDIDSYIDYWFVNELVYNFELGHPKSVYMHKDRETSPVIDSKIHAGPVWDFDLCFYPPDGWAAKEKVWYTYLFKDPAFVARTKEKWAAQKGYYMTVAETYIDEIAGKVNDSVARDLVMWYDVANAYSSFASNAASIKSSLINRINWMDTEICAFVVNYDDRGTGTEDYSGQTNPDFGFGF